MVLTLIIPLVVWVGGGVPRSGFRSLLPTVLGVGVVFGVGGAALAPLSLPRGLAPLVQQQPYRHSQFPCAQQRKGEGQGCKCRGRRAGVPLALPPTPPPPWPSRKPQLKVSPHMPAPAGRRGVGDFWGPDRLAWSAKSAQRVKLKEERKGNGGSLMLCLFVCF